MSLEKSGVEKNRSLNNLISDALAIEDEAALEAGKVGFMARMLVQATMPHSDPKDHTFERVNGSFTLSMTAGSPKIGLPYGTIPRLLLSWITTEAVKTKERELILGDSMSGFMRQLDLVPTGGRWGSVTRLKDQTKRLFSASVSCYTDTPEGYQNINFHVVKRSSLWWEPKNPHQQTLWQSSILLDADFFDEITNRPVPIDMRALKALKRSPLALDIYNWLTYRMSYLNRSTVIPWEALQMQFGSSYAEKRIFKYKFLEALKKVQLVYPEAKVCDSDNGLRLTPSKPHIAKS